MRTNIEIDDELLEQVRVLCGDKSKEAIIDEALRLLLRMKSQQKLKDLQGKLQWEGNLEEMRFD